MESAVLEKIAAWFDEFPSRWFGPCPAEMPALAVLKIEHSRRVAAECRSLARDLGWVEGDVMLAEAAGLLHDVGRFPQLRRYGTLYDALSANHGELGWKEISKSEIPGMLGDGERDALLDAVLHHNQLKAPSGMPELSSRILGVVRDADKLDILDVVRDTVQNRRFGEFPEIFERLDLDGPVNAELIREILETRSASYRNARSLADFTLLQLSWIYDMNHAETLRRYAERGFLDYVRRSLPADRNVCAVISEAERFISGRVGDASPGGPACCG